MFNASDPSYPCIIAFNSSGPFGMRTYGQGTVGFTAWSFFSSKENEEYSLEQLEKAIMKGEKPKMWHKRE